MLNKELRVNEAVWVLYDILERTQQIQVKKTSMSRSLNIACGALEPPHSDAAAARRCSV